MSKSISVKIKSSKSNRVKDKLCHSHAMLKSSHVNVKTKSKTSHVEVMLSHKFKLSKSCRVRLKSYQRKIMSKTNNVKGTIFRSRHFKINTCQ